MGLNVPTACKQTRSMQQIVLVVEKKEGDTWSSLRISRLCGVLARAHCFRTRLAVGLLACFLSTLQSVADCTPTASGLISWWPAEGNAADIISTNSGVLQGGATANATGMVAQAFSFDGTNAYVQIPDAPSLRPTNLTVECWVRFSALDSSGSGAAQGVQYIVFKQ